MHRTEVKIAHLDESHLDKIGVLESELGAVVVAYEPTYKPASLSEEQVAKLKALEAELGLILVAFSPK
jgi:hypothetical protein